MSKAINYITSPSNRFYHLFASAIAQLLVKWAYSNAEKLIKEHWSATLMNTSSNKKSRHTSPSGITYVKRPRDSPEFWLTEAKACCDPGYFVWLPNTWLRWPLPLVISSWGLKSSPHRDTQISAKNKIRMLPAIARSIKQPYVLLDNLLHSYNNIPQGTCKAFKFLWFQFLFWHLC